MKDPTGVIRKQLVGKHNEINGKYVDIKVAEDNKTREKVEKSSCKVFVGGIEGTVSTEELRDFFLMYGKVKEAVVLKNINTNTSRGFGFVTFEDSTVADKLIRENNCVLKGKRMDIKTAEPKETSVPRSRDNMRGGYNNYGGNRGGYNNQGGNYGGDGGMGRDYRGGRDGGHGGRHGGHGGYGGRGGHGGGHVGYSRHNDRNYSPPQYDNYPQDNNPRYGDYMNNDPAPVATMPSYAPPQPKNDYQSQPNYGYGNQRDSQKSTYSDPYSRGTDTYSQPKGSYGKQSYGTQQSYGDQSQPTYAPQAQPSYGAQAQAQPSYGSHQPAYSSSQTGYEQVSGYGQTTSQAYGSHYGKSHTDQYTTGGGSGGNRRDYGAQNKGHRYKPY